MHISASACGWHVALHLMHRADSERHAAGTPRGTISKTDVMRLLPLQSCAVPVLGRAMYKTVVCSSTAVRKGLHTPEVTHKGPCCDQYSHSASRAACPARNTVIVYCVTCIGRQIVLCQELCCSSQTCRGRVTVGINGCKFARMQAPRPSARSHRSTSMTLTSSPSAEAAQECEPHAIQPAWVRCPPCPAACKQGESTHVLLGIPWPRCAFQHSALPVRDRSLQQWGMFTPGCPESPECPRRSKGGAVRAAARLHLQRG